MNADEKQSKKRKKFLPQMITSFDPFCCYSVSNKFVRIQTICIYKGNRTVPFERERNH